MPTLGGKWYDVRRVTIPALSEIPVSYDFQPDQIIAISETMTDIGIEFVVEGIQGGGTIPLYGQGPIAFPGLGGSQDMRIRNLDTMIRVIRLVAQQGWPPTQLVAPTLIGGGLGGVLTIPITGWIDQGAGGETWTRVTNTTFTVGPPGDQTVDYRGGMKIRLRQGGGWKYFYVISSAFALGITTVTVTGGIDFLLVAGAITDNYISPIDNPEGFPGWFNFTIGYTGFAINPTTAWARFRVEGSYCRISYSMAAAGTSNAVTFTLTNFPIPILAPSVFQYTGWGIDNNLNLVIPLRTDLAGTVMTLFSTVNVANAWTPAGQKGFYNIDTLYRIT